VNFVMQASVPLVEGPQELQDPGTADGWTALFFDAQPRVQLAAAGLFFLSVVLLVALIGYWRATRPTGVVGGARPLPPRAQVSQTSGTPGPFKWDGPPPATRTQPPQRG
jgi:hypothetical protein